MDHKSKCREGKNMPLDAYGPISLIMLMAGMTEGQEQVTR